MSRIYAVPFSGTITNSGGNVDLWSLQPADDKPIRLVGFTLGQITEVGDTAEESLDITVNRLPSTFTVGSGGSSVTAKAPVGSSADTAWSFTARVNDTTVATTSGTLTVEDQMGWNVRNTPYEHWYPDPEARPGAVQGQGLVIRCESTVADDINFRGVAYVEEIG